MDADDARPINLAPEAAICPACGKANQCGAVAAGRHDVACWCASVVIPATATNGRDPMRCLCPDCAGVRERALGVIAFPG